MGRPWALKKAWLEGKLTRFGVPPEPITTAPAVKTEKQQITAAKDLWNEIEQKRSRLKEIELDAELRWRDLDRKLTELEKVKPISKVAAMRRDLIKKIAEWEHLTQTLAPLE
jgi:hypothetical protein